MRIATITNWAYGLTLILTFGSGAAFMTAVAADKDERIAVERRSAAIRIADDIELIEARLSDQARLYVEGGKSAHKMAWINDSRGAGHVIRIVDRLNGFLPPAQKAELRAADRALEGREAIERAAIAAADRGDRTAGRAMLYGADYQALDAEIARTLTSFKQTIRTRLDAELHAARQRADRWDDVARVLLGLTAFLFIAVLYFILARRVTRPLTHMSAIVTRMADRDFEADLPDDRHQDEIGDVTQALRLLRRNTLERERLEQERDEDRRIKDLLARMMHRMHGCEIEGELTDVVACYVPQIFPDLTGHLFVYDHARAKLTSLGHWGAATKSAFSFSPTFCWGLRRGHAHRSNADAQDVACQHLDDLATEDCLCMPLMAQGGIVGMLYFEARETSGQYADRGIYIDLMSENIALALANIQLRATLGALATRDPLTGLSNRRHLDEVFNVEHAQAQAHSRSLACLMIDIDHFKRFNDEFGHDAGDLVMKHVAQVLLSHSGDSDLAFRYGGEEFAMLLPGLDSAQAAARAEDIRQTVRKVALAWRGRPLHPVTVSIGVAAFPAESDATSLLSVADSALLAAKENGRDQVVIAGTTPPRSPGRVKAAG